ncbi:MAG: metallophosphoesterase [Pseudomonadota bacterium]
MRTYPPDNMDQQARAAAGTARIVHLRILATTDVHANLLGFDYVSRAASSAPGLAHVARRIRNHRNEHPNCLVFDNGDVLQGTMLGDIWADTGPLSEPNPVVRAMNEIGYDAATLGNHDFNFGLAPLRRALLDAGHPVVVTNLELIEAASEPLNIKSSAILTRELLDETGASLKLRIGVLGFIPPETVLWDRLHLEGKVRITPIAEAARRGIDDLKRTGVDVIVALAHSGIATDGSPDGERAVTILAGMPGIDAIVSGHSHAVFPSGDFANTPGVDLEHGLINDVPVTMPGASASHLGVIDLSLSVAQTGTHAFRAGGTVERISVQVVPPDDSVATTVQTSHLRTLVRGNEVVGSLATPVHGHFAFTPYDPVPRLIGLAQLHAATKALRGTRHACLPVLSAAATFRTGISRDVDIPAGPVTRAECYGLYPFPNRIALVRITLTLLRTWIARSAEILPTSPRGNVTPLVASAPSYDFDVILGAQYLIDTARGPGGPDLPRLQDLKVHGRKVDEDDEMIVATNSYRIASWSREGFDLTQSVIHEGPETNYSALVDFFQNSDGPVEIPPPVWRFAPVADAAFELSCDAEARRYVEGLPGVKISSDHADEHLRVRLPLDLSV